MDFFEIGSYSGGVWAKSQGQICDEDQQHISTHWFADIY